METSPTPHNQPESSIPEFWSKTQGVIEELNGFDHIPPDLPPYLTTMQQGYEQNDEALVRWSVVNAFTIVRKDVATIYLTPQLDALIEDIGHQLEKEHGTD